MGEHASCFAKVAAAEGLLPWRGGRWLVSREWGQLAEQDIERTAAGPLIRSLRAQPLLIVLRPDEPLQAAPTLARLQALGVTHVEIAWKRQSAWIDQMAQLRWSFPGIALGAASVCDPQGVMDAAAAGCRYVVSPVLDPELLEVAVRWQTLLIPGVMSPSEVHHALRLGCRIVKLFPAVSVGIHHWRRLRDPLGDPLPFCIAAGGLSLPDVQPWLAAGVDAVALGASLFPEPAGSALEEAERLTPLRQLLAEFATRAASSPA